VPWCAPGQLSLSGNRRTKSTADANPGLSYQELLKGVRETVKDRGQKPQLSTSRRIVRPSICHPLAGCLSWFSLGQDTNHTVHPVTTTYYDKSFPYHYRFRRTRFRGYMLPSLIDTVLSTNRDPCFCQPFVCASSSIDRMFVWASHVFTYMSVGRWISTRTAAAPLSMPCLVRLSN
jgi:hypothetical protein